MLLFTIMLLIFFAILILAATIPLKVVFAFNSEQLSNFHLIASWINGLFKGVLVRKNNLNIIKVYLFKKEIYSKILEMNKGNPMDKLDMLKSMDYHHFEVYASYGFEDPSVTGMVCSAIELISGYISVSRISNIPNFNTDKSFFNINGEVKLNIISLANNLFKYNKSNLNINTAHSSK